MSFLTFLCIASIVYLCAADPIAESPTAVADQERLDSFMRKVEQAYDEEIAVILAGLSDGDRDYLKVTTLDGVGSFINYSIWRAKQEEDIESINKSVDNGYIVMQFNSDSASSMPAVPCLQPPVPTQV